MSEILHIKNFGPIKDMSFEFKKINILIGDQGTGKSSVAKLYSVLKLFLTVKFFNLQDSELEEDDNWQFEQYVNQFEIKDYFNEKTEIYYKSALDIEVRYLSLKVSRTSSNYTSFSPSFTYIVAERVYVSTLADALYGLIETGAKLPTLFNRFGNKFLTARKTKSKSLFSELIGVDFSHTNGADNIIMEDGKIIPLLKASSGMQGTIPLLVVYDTVVENIFARGRADINENNLMVIEEPELNLFPETQRKVIHYLIGNNFEIPNIPLITNNENPDNPEVDFYLGFEYKEFKNQLLITTHSPYVLTTMNNLMYAFSVGKNNAEKASKIIDQKYWVNPDEVSAYILLDDGICENIIDKDVEGATLIKVEKIDEISKQLNIEFNQLIDLEIINATK